MLRISTALALITLAALPHARLSAADEPLPELKLLFLGDRGHHQPAERAKQLLPYLATRGIAVDYSERLDDLNPATLSAYDGIIIYANWGAYSSENEKALLDFVASGKGFIPLHCASYCFIESPKYIELVGAQFASHGTGVFRTKIVEPEHPCMKDAWEFETWDETYVHKHHGSDRTILQVREDGGHVEPWTWTRTHGKGRVFYTAYGHDDRTFGQPAFHALVERGVRWACGDDRVILNGLPQRSDLEPFRYTKGVKLPNYLPGRSWGTQGDAIDTMQLPLSPAESEKHYVLPTGFDIELFASEPDIHKPICMAWDARGRLWIAETTDYPNEIKPDREGEDQIKICEDTDGDGRADRFTVFADKLSIPTSLAFARGGVIVHQAPHTLFLADTDGDDRADRREVLFTGWSTGDTHAGPSNLQYGFDNWLYGIVGYSGFRGTIGDEEHRFAQGFYRFRPDGSKMEFLRNTNNNSWGVGFSEDGVLFGSTANDNPSVYLPIPNRYHEAVRGWSSQRLGTIARSSRFFPITDKVRQVDQHGRFTAGAGHALYTARLFPEAYWNRTAFVAGPTGHLLAVFHLEADGADFVSRNVWNLAASDDEWAAPIAAEVGPDSAVWMIDWYNYIIQHNPTPQGFKTGKGNAYETELRDKAHGRIYRIVPRGAKLPASRDLAKATPAELVAELSNENLFWRRHAQRLLVERGEKDVVPALVARLTEAPRVDAVGLDVGAIHALWTLHGLGALDGSDDDALAAAERALLHPSAGVRRNAVAVLPSREESVAAVVRARSLVDADAQVRLAAFLTLADAPSSRLAGEAIAATARLAENLEDRWIPDAITSAAARHDVHFLAGVARASGELPERLAAVVARVAEHHARGGPSSTLPDLLTALAKAKPAVADAVVDGLARGWPDDAAIELDARSNQAALALVKSLSGASKARYLALASRWRVEGLDAFTQALADELLEVAENSEKSEAERVDAAQRLVEIRSNDSEVLEALVDVIDARATPGLATGVLGALATSAAPELGGLLAESLSAWTPATQREALAVLLRRGPWTEALLAAAEEGGADLALLSLDEKQALARHPDEKIAAHAKAVLARAGGLPDPDRQAVIDALHPILEKRGNAAKGKEVFKTLCAKCHSHSGEGKQIGPDLTGMAAHPKEELLVHILDPSRSVEGNFRQYTAVTKTGQVLSGMLASETRTSVDLIDTNGETKSIQRADLASLQGSRLSLMPEGFEKQTTEEGLTDLLEFLTARGKYLPLVLDKVASASSVRGMFYEESNRGETLDFRDWSPKTFQGVPFYLVDPQGGARANVLLFHGPQGKIPPRMPKSVTLPVNAPARALHFLSGIGGWNAQAAGKRGLTLIARLHYDDGTTEAHELFDGLHFADYIGPFEVPESKLAFRLRGRQVRYFAITPEHPDRTIKTLELEKGTDGSAPIVVAITLESP